MVTAVEKLRGDLHQQALQVGMTTTSQGIFGLMSEPFHNGTTAIGATIGRLVGHFTRTPARVLTMESNPVERSDDEGRRAA